MRLLLAVACSMVAGAPAMNAAGTAPPNVLLICTDDLRPMLRCYGAEWMHTPNIDALAERGMLFERAYCQAAQCGPSRVSFMTGLRPETAGVFSLRDHFDYEADKSNDSLTIARKLRANGYATQAFGKIFHDERDDPFSWSEGASPGRVGEILEVVPEGGGATVIASREDCPAWQAPDVADDALYGGRMTGQVVQAMITRKQDGRRFFLAVGYRRPHLPFVAPKRYYDLYPDRAAHWLLPESAMPPNDGPVFGFYNSTNYAPAPGKKSRWPIPPPLSPSSRAEALAFAGYELRSYSGVPARGALDEDLVRDLRRAYAACVSYVDAQIGRLLTGLQDNGLADNTVVVLLSDHGWHLGEHGTWSKMTNYEWATRVPLIVAVPRAEFSPGRCRVPVELVDLYPTICELAGVTVPTRVEGKSLVPLLRDPEDLAWQDAAAFSQFPRKSGPMGKTLRTERWRYVEWRDEKSGELAASELYDHESDPGELQNLAGRPEHSALLDALSARLKAGG